LPQPRTDDSQETIRERRIALLTKSKDALYLTLDRIRGDRFHVCGIPVDDNDANNRNKFSVLRILQIHSFSYFCDI